MDHLLLECCGTRAFFNDWVRAVGSLGNRDWEWPDLRVALFSGGQNLLLSAGHQTASVLFVGRCCAAAAEHYTPDDSMQGDIDSLIIDAMVSAA